jgi:prepilin-type N-terminal cleavage/methylation domain-containing protein
METIDSHLRLRLSGADSLRVRRFAAGSRAGFTLAESLIASVVLAIAAIGVFQTLAACAQQSQSFDFESAETAMGRSLLEQIAARSFDSPTTNDHPGYSAANPTCDAYDDIGDFENYTDTIAADEVDESGATLRTLHFTRTVTVEFREAPSGGAMTTRSAATPFAMVTIVVTPPDGVSAAPTTLCRLMTRYTRG